jgi:hypothetical protein
VTGDLLVVPGGADSVLGDALVAGTETASRVPGHRHVEQPPLVGVGALVAFRAEQLPRDQLVAGPPGARRGEAAGGQRGHEHHRPLQALGLVDRGQADRVDQQVGLAVEVLVGALGVVGDADGQVQVVPVASSRCRILCSPVSKVSADLTQGELHLSSRGEAVNVS